jgi:hypothetical protein
MKALPLLACLGLPAFFAVGYVLVPSKPENTRSAISKPLVGSASALGQGIQASAVLKEIRDANDPLEARLKLLSIIESATPGDLERIFNSARLSDDLSARNAAAQHWAEIDPQGFVAHLKTLRADEMEELNEVTAILFRTWAHRDPEAALAMAKKSEKLTGFQGARPAAVSGILEDDPDKGFALLAKEKNLYLEQVFKKAIWEKDPARFVKASAQAGDTLNMYGNAWMMDPYSGGPMNAYGTTGIYGLAGARNEALAAWAAADFPAALEWAKSLKADGRAGVMPLLLGKLAETDLNQARGIFESLAPSKERESVGPAIVAQWAKTDPTAALAWIEEKMTGGKSQAYSSWIRAVASNGMEKAASLLATLPEGNGRDYATRTLAMEWANKDVTGAVTWIKTMQDGEDRRDAYGNVARQWAQKDQAGFKEFVATVPRAELPDQYTYYLYGRTREEQDKNLIWAATLPEDRRDPIFLNMFSQSSWNRKPAEIVELLGQVDNTDLQVRAGTQVLNEMLYNDTAKAEELLGLLPSSFRSAEKREQLRTQIQAIGNLSDADKQKLLKKLQ